MEVLKGELNSTSTYVPAQLTKDQLLVYHINTLTKTNVKIDKCELPTFYWLPKLHTRPCKSRFISHSSHCSTSILSKHITSALTAVKDHVMKYSETAFSNSNINYCWSVKKSSEVIEKLRLRNFQGSQVSSFDFSTLYTSLPHDFIKAKVLSLINWCFNRESKSYLCSSLKAGFFSNKKYDSYRCWSCAELCEAFTFLMENIHVQFDGMVYQAKLRKYQEIFGVKSRVKTWQVRGIWSQQLGHKSHNGGRKQVSGRVSVPCLHATPVANAQWKPLIIGEGQARYQCHEIGGKSDWFGSHCWSRIRMSFNIRERDTSYC